ncbi:MAG: peptidylprolyl isomerase [Magnetococcales bacterium]|nr:peptidylprolyl isomerase [Magnetococcales bacterium]
MMFNWKKSGIRVVTALVAAGWLGMAPVVNAAQPAAAAADKGTPLATMGSVTLTVEEFQKFLNFSGKEVKTQLLANPELMNQQIGKILLRKFVLAKAKEQKWDKKDDIVFKMERVKEDLVIESFLDNQNKAPANFPDDALVKQAYEQNKTKFMAPHATHLGHLFLKFDEKMDDKAKQDLVKIAEKYVGMIQKKESDFGSLAKKYSQDNSKDNDGDLGWIPTANLLPEFKKGIEGLKNGEVSAPIRSAQGVHILQFLGTREPTPRPLEQVKGLLVQQLKNQKLQENKNAYIKEQVTKNPLSLNDANRGQLK